MIKNIESQNDFNEVLNNQKLCIVDFSAVWCGPCRMMEPVLENTASEYGDKFNFYKVDIDRNQELASKFSIMYVPTFVILKNGVEVSRKSGYIEKEDFENFILENFKKTEN